MEPYIFPLARRKLNPDAQMFIPRKENTKYHFRLNISAPPFSSSRYSFDISANEESAVNHCLLPIIPTNTREGPSDESAYSHY